MLGGRMFVVALAAAAASAGACSSEDGGAGACGPESQDEVPNDLACTGLYSDFATRTIAPTARAYAPGVAFWSDGLDKDRYIELPEGQTVDATSMDDWKFPNGTKVWKDIHKGPKKVETRFFWKTNAGKWLQTSYVWSEDGTKATVGAGTDVMLDGEPYHIPTTTECSECHRGRRDKLLGFEAVSLAQPGATGVTLATLAREDKIVPKPAVTAVTVPNPAYGVLHVNCGVTCHNATPSATAETTGLRLRLAFEELAANEPEVEWDLYKTLVGVETTSAGRAGLRVKAGAPDESELVKAMGMRGDGQMPPLASTVVDTQGVDVVKRWIEGLR
ncbi:MAG: hypothetical protein KIT84_43890 [Labilithrix sp.]|nr:hypothetical protein [Labilithrix sp.]MCW5818020.1 hypothetical protein [Labilithrix sp.]